MQKRLLIILLFLLVLPSVFAMNSQDFIDKYNLVIWSYRVAPQNYAQMTVLSSGSVVLGSPVPGDIINLKFFNDVLYRQVWVADDDNDANKFVKNYGMSGNTPHSVQPMFWLDKEGEINIDTIGWTPNKDYHIITASWKYDPVRYAKSSISPYYDGHWNLYTFRLDSQRKAISPTVTIIKPNATTTPSLVSKTIGRQHNPNLKCQNTLPAKLTKGTYTLCKQNYDLNQNIPIWDDDVVLDCNGATLNRAGQPSQTAITLELRGKGITIKNCLFNNVRLSALEEKENIIIENNEFIGMNTYLSLAVSKSSIKNNIIDSMTLTSNTVSPTAPKVEKNIIENNKIGAINVFESNENSILNNEIIQIVLEGSSKNIIKNNNIVMAQNYAQTSVPANMIVTNSNNLASNNNQIEGNTLDGQGYTNTARPVLGIMLGNGDNNVVKNIIKNYEIGILSTLASENNIVKNNDFFKNQVQVIDNNDHKNNYEQNYYDNHQCIKQGNYCTNTFQIKDDSQSIVMVEDNQPSAIKNN